MSTVRDAEGNILNPPTPAVVAGKYSDERAIDVDWFDLHPEDRSTEAEVAFVEATVSAEQAALASGKNETLSELRDSFVGEVLAAKGDTVELREARENFLNALEADKPQLQASEVPAIEAPVVEPPIEVPLTEPTEIKENQNGTIDSNPSDKNVESSNSSVSPRTDV